MPFDTRVFINCPFDPDFKPIFRAIIFITSYAGLEPRISETTSSGRVRILDIIEKIRNSKYGIHDLSRSHPAGNEPPRFNMPYELGIDVGCAQYGNAYQKEKMIMILERDQYHYQRILSDISGQDIFRHNDQPIEAMDKVREWLITNGFDLPGTEMMWLEFNRFTEHLHQKLQPRFTEAEIAGMPEGHYIPHVRSWVRDYFA